MSPSHVCMPIESLAWLFQMALTQVTQVTTTHYLFFDVIQIANTEYLHS